MPRRWVSTWVMSTDSVTLNSTTSQLRPSTRRSLGIERPPAPQARPAPSRLFTGTPVLSYCSYSASHRTLAVSQTFLCETALADPSNADRGRHLLESYRSPCCVSILIS